MRTDLTSPALTTTDIARALLTGVAAGTVSAGLRWTLFRFERKRRLARLDAKLDEAGKAFGDALAQARMGLEQMARGGKVLPFPPLGGDALSVNVDTVGPFEVPHDQLDKIFEDLNRYRGESGSL